MRIFVHIFIRIRNELSPFLYFLLLFTLLTGCSQLSQSTTLDPQVPTAASGEEPSTEHISADSLNANTLASLLGLKQVTSIQIFTFDENSGDWSTELITLKDDELISELVATLNEAPSFMPRARCISQYRLILQQLEGESVQLDYLCNGGETYFLRGEQEFWDDQDANAPDAFIEYMTSVLDR